MTKLPPLRAREVIRGLETLGFQRVRQSGSHAMFHHQDCRRAPVPVHPTKTISRYLLSDMLKRLGIDEEVFVRAVRR